MNDNDHNCCNNCEYHHQGICNAGKTPTENPRENNECGDWELIDTEKRKRASQKLQAQIKRQVKHWTPPHQLTEEAMLARLNEIHDEARQRQFFQEFLGIPGHPPYPPTPPTTVHHPPGNSERRRLYHHIMDKINDQKSYIVARFNLEPTYAMIHPRTYRELHHEVLASNSFYERDLTFKKLVTRYFDLEIIEAPHVRELDVEVVISAEDLGMRRR